MIYPIVVYDALTTHLIIMVALRVAFLRPVIE